MEIGNLLIARNDRLGDWVLTFPLLEEIREAWPGVRLAAMAPAAVAPLLERRPEVERVLLSPGRSWRGFRRAVREVRAGGFEAAVVVHPDLVDTLVVWAAGVRLRVGNGYRAYSVFYDRRVMVHRSPSDRHEIEYNLEYLAGLGLAVPDTPREPRVEVTPAERAQAAEILAAHGLSEAEYVVVHPGSGGSSLNWSPARYRILAAELTKATGYAVVVTGSAAETELASAVAGEGRGRANVAGETDLGALVGLLAGARLFVSGNTGPMHLAAAVGTPTVSLFAPLRSGSPGRWGPRGKAAAVITPSGYECEKCPGPRCAHYNCMEAISVEEVLTEVRRLLATKGD
ncbi:MAG: glycosyltransferase family 9 protein [Candidatus Coatesbacteria bacterium]|nr:MAG: glycosyltransferase family 9 protein [Candidatus Coatesbacteria bacterium]